jgi:hypothetical protein
MLKKLFFMTLCLSFCSSLKANTAMDALYGDYVNCYYEMNQNPNNPKFVGKQTVSESREGIKGWGKENITDLLSTTTNDAYIFSYEGFFGVTPPKTERRICDRFHGSETATVCAFDFKAKAGSSIYDLCYVKEWLGGNEYEDTYQELVYDGSCSEHKIFAINKILKTPELATEQLSSTYFTTILYPFLQRMYTNFAYRYIWGMGFRGYLCVDSKTKSKSNGLFRQAPETKENLEYFKGDFKERTDEFNKIFSDDNSCYSACKKLGIITTIKY